MSDRKETFAVGQRPRLELRLATGDVRVVPGSPGVVDVTIRGHKPETVIVEQIGDTVVIRQETGRWSAGAFDMTVHAPAGVDVEASLASTDLTIEVDVSDLQVSVASGDIRARRIGRDVSVKSASGDVEIDEVGGKLRATAASGDVTIGVISGDATCSTASGEVVVGLAKGDLAAKSASGDVTIDEFCGGDLRGKTVSGDMRVGLARGVRVDVDLQSLTGNLQLPSSPSPAAVHDRPTVRISFKSVSGDFELVETVRPGRQLES
jgi:DUF4097 and DUF4098 domain-containing protein YvlB